MATVTELRVALTVTDFGQALAFYRDTLGLQQLAGWSSETARVVVLAAGRATLELLDHAQAVPGRGVGKCSDPSHPEPGTSC